MGPVDVRPVQVTAAPAEDGTNLGQEFHAEAETESPMLLFFNDLKTFAQNIPYIIDVVRPFGGGNEISKVPGGKLRLIADYTIVVLLVLIEIPILFGFIPAFFVLPGWAFSLSSLGCYCLVRVVAGLMWGSLTVQSRTQLDVEKFKDEQWIFINGIATGHAMLQKSCDALAATFKRPILGIHNQSWGIIGDLVECLIQRSFNYSTQDVRVAFGALKYHLQDDRKTKVVVIAHSQGGILIAMVLDRLYTQLAASDFAKLEVYTFGSAAKSFNNPLTSLAKAQSGPVTPNSPASPPTPPPRKAETPQFGMTPRNAARVQIPDHLIPYVEHYCNENDMVPRWGVLYHIIRSTPTTYSGRVFVHENQPGHLFDNHYLGRMFPLLQMDSQDPSIFPNHRVENNQRPLLLKATTFNGNVDRVYANGAPANALTRVAGDADGLKVKELSRLWKYMNGGSP